MNRWKFDSKSKKKVRGLRRRKMNLMNTLHEMTEQLPNPNDYGLGYWHLHLPFSQEYLESDKVPIKFRKEIMQTLINKVCHLKNLKTPLQEQYRIYAVISMPNLFDSQIAVIPDKSWFNGFFERDTSEQKWLPLSLNRDVIKEWELYLPPGLEVKGFEEIISDDDYYYEGELWFIGEIN